MGKDCRRFRIGAWISLIVFLASLAYMLAIVKLRLYFESRYYPTPIYYSFAAAWPLCALSGALLPVLVAKGRIALPRALRLSLALLGGGCSLVFLYALCGYLLITGDMLSLGSTGLNRYLYLLSIELMRMPGLFFPPCALLATALAGGDKAKPSAPNTQDTPSELPADSTVSNN